MTTLMSLLTTTTCYLLLDSLRLLVAGSGKGDFPWRRELGREGEGGGMEERRSGNSRARMGEEVVLTACVGRTWRGFVCVKANIREP